MGQIPVLMYHALEDANHPSGSTDPGAKFYEIHVETFRTQMRYLSTNGYQTYLLEEVLQLSVFPENIVVLTFDDGHCSNYELALPILQEYGFRAEFFITTGWIGRRGYLSSTQIHKMAQLGMGIGSHGVTHSFLDDLADDEVRTELLDSSRVLGKMTGKDIIAFSAPGGRINAEVTTQGKQAGYKIFCGSEFDYLRDEGCGACLPRLVITQAVKPSEFKKMVGTDLRFLLKNRRKYYFLSCFKRILGNQAYAAMHSFISRGRRMVLK